MKPTNVRMLLFGQIDMNKWNFVRFDCVFLFFVKIAAVPWLCGKYNDISMI